MDRNHFSAQKDVRLFLIEDDPLVREYLSLSFQRKGCQVTAFDNAEEALKILCSQNCNAILCDYELPGMNGIEFFWKVSESSPDVIRILMTGYKSTEACKEARKAGIDEFIEKPFTSAVWKRVLGLLEREKGKDETVDRRSRHDSFQPR